MLTIAADPKHLGTRIAITAVLHTWGSAMTHHPHVHMIVPGGGIALDGSRWVACKPSFFLPALVLSKLFRRLLLEKLATACKAGKLTFFGAHAHLADTKAFAAFLAPLKRMRWFVYAKRPFAAPKAVPDYAAALSMAAWCHAQRCVYNWTDDLDGESRLALELANKAVKLAANDSFTLSMLGAAHTLVRDFGTAYELLQRALEIDSNCAWGWNRLGWLNGYLDRPNFEKAIRLSPLDPINFNCFAGIGAAHFLDGRHDLSINWFEKALAANPDAQWVYRQLVPAYVAAGRMEEAKRGLRLLLQGYPTLTCKRVRLAMLYTERTMNRICSGLTQAGLPIA